MFYALATDEPTYAEKVSLYVALAPVTKISHNKDPLLNFAVLWYDDIYRAANLFGIHGILKNNFITSGAMKLFC